MTKHSTTVHSGTDKEAATFAPEVAPASSSAPAFTQLTRAPLVPEPVLKRHGAYCAIDTRFRSAARLQQALWLKSRNIATAADAHPDTDGFLGSILSADAARAGQNFLSADIHQLAVREWLFCEPDAAIDPVRLFSNSLSSMPLCLNLLGPMALNLDLATAVFRLLFPDFVDSVQRVLFEHAPSGRDRTDARWLADRSAFDFAAHVTTPDGEPGVIYGETKLSENMAAGPAARMRDRYGQASKQVRLYRDPDSATLRSVAIEQLWREHMLAQLAVDNSVTPRSLFTAVAPQLNRNAQVAFKIYQAELLDADQREPDRVAFVPLTLETFIEAIAQAGACELAQALWGRYCDLGPVVRLAMQEITGDEASSPETRLRADTSAAIKPPLPPVRRRSRSSSRSRTNMASSTSKVVAKVTTGQEAI
jgi:PD-(D/E)XK nuclease superfamily